MFKNQSFSENSPQLPSISSPPTSFESCSVGNGGCQHACTMTASRNTITCICRIGYELHSDGKRCIGKCT